MKRSRIGLFAVLCSLVPLHANALSLESATFRAGAALPLATAYDRSGCRGGNHAPELHWRDVPAKTRSFALVVHDPDAPVSGGWWHWARFDIPASVRSLPYGVQNGRDGRDARTSWNENAYDGPCPPPGPAHHYVFTLYALDVAHVRGAGASSTAPELVRTIGGHVLARATLIGRYAEP